MIRLEAICIGDELLDGRVLDRNAAALGDFARERGALLTRIEIVGDEPTAIVDALRRTSAEVVVVSGGLGPTRDDMTREAAATFAGKELVLDEGSLDRIRQRFAARNFAFTENNRKQATFPHGAEVLRTEVGTAPAFRLEVDGRDFFFFPGVPREYRWFLDRALRPRLGTAERGHERRRLFFHGLGESTLESRIADVAEKARQAGVSVGYRADYPLVELKLAGPASAVSDAHGLVIRRVGECLVAEDEETLPARIGRLLLEEGATLTTAESCTAGGISALITEAPGASAWFQRSFVTYANAAKAEELGVSQEILIEHGAVSAQTVAQMAAGAKRRTKSSFALAVSGIAGPTGGTQQKPVGTVHFGLATPEGVYHRLIRYRLPDRQMIRIGTAWSAVAFLLWRLENRLEKHSYSGPYSDDEVWSESGIAVPESA